VSVLPSEAVVHQYIDDVLDGTIPACRWVKLAAERHLRDLDAAAERGLCFDASAAQLVIDFFGLLRHSKGEWAGRTLELEPWQQFVTWVLFGWQNEDGTRRYRTAYVEVARKNGKSTWAAGIGVYLLVADGEPGAEVYSAATKRDQARIVHAEATRMVKASPALRRRVTVFRDNLHIEGTASKYEPLSSDYDSLDGLNLHGGIVDELHAHKTRDLWDVLDTATGSRLQALLLAITTAGYDRNSVCYEKHDYTEKVLSGAVEDDTWFGIIYTLDQRREGDPAHVTDDVEGDAWGNETNWIKANPNLGVSKKLDDMRRKAIYAAEVPAALTNFLRKELNIWTQSVTKWVPWEHWNACGKAVDPLGLRGRRCYGGLDLSSNTDISALVWVFPPEVDGDSYQVLCRFWVPGERVRERVSTDHVPYDAWVRQGYITTTPGNVVDYDFILAQVGEDLETYDAHELAFDRWGATKIQTDLMEMGCEDFLVQFGQGYASMSGPTKELERLILGHELAHGNNPVLNWMADNLVVRSDPAGNIKPDKERSIERIDGMVSLVMALGRAMVHEQAGSVYEERGLLTL